LAERAREHPDAVYCGCGDDRLTFAQADAAADRVSAGLAALGVRRGDHVAIIAPNRMELFELFLGCARLGAVQVPLNVFLKGEFLRYQLADSQSSTLVCDAAGLAAAAEVRDALPDLARVIALDDVADGTIPYERVRASDAPVVADAVRPGDLLAIMYTSGTTGMPKGCMLSHAQYVNNARVSQTMLDYRGGDVLYTALPMFHAWAQSLIVSALVHRMTTIIDPVFSASAAPARLAQTRATVFGGVGAMAMAMLAQPETADDVRLRAALVFPLSAADQDRFAARYGGLVQSQMYGQTETGAITFSRLGSAGNPASVGRPSPAFDVRLVDDDDNEVPAGDVGEFVVRPRVPHALYEGYWRKPEETLRAWRNLWHHTGDYGRADADGFMYFVDRKKDALRRRGENVSSIQLEAAIAGHPKIAEAAVHGVPSAMTEDDIKACVVLAQGATVGPDELFAFFRETLPYFAIPRYVEVVSELPKTATMRIMKHVLRERGVTPTTWDLEALGLMVSKADRR
jgi:crotonobetaine/carnitine-CoA ligase